MIHYIYCYTNKINNHKYVGQTNNYERRIREHRSCAFNEKASSFNDSLSFLCYLKSYLAISN